MLLTRTVTRTFDFYQEVEIDETLIENFEELGEELDVEDLIHSYNESEFARVWEVLEDIHSSYDDIIFEEKMYGLPHYDDECEYSIIDNSEIKEKVAAV